MTQFEGLIRLLAQHSANAQKLNLFYNTIALATKQMSRAKVPLKGSYSRPVSTSMSSDGSELDINIKEALEALKTRGRSRRNSQSRTPLKSSSRIISSRVAKSSQLSENHSLTEGKDPAVKTIETELDEFLEMEKLVQNEVMKVTVSLGESKQVAPKHSFSERILVQPQKEPKKIRPDISSKKTLDKHVNPGKVGESAGSQEQKKPLAKTQQQEKRENARIEEKTTEWVVETPNGSVQRHRKYIAKVRQTTFSREFILRLVFFAWKTIKLNSSSF